jgi:hypothetical protein
MCICIGPCDMQVPVAAMAATAAVVVARAIAVHICTYVAAS